MFKKIKQHFPHTYLRPKHFKYNRFAYESKKIQKFKNTKNNKKMLKKIINP